MKITHAVGAVGVQRALLKTRTALTHRFADFWMLGGASLVVWLLFTLSGPFRGHVGAIDRYYLMIGGLFGALALLCNHPHFMVSYAIAYRQGGSFMKRHWFPLVAVPLFLIGAFSLAYFDFESGILDGIGHYRALGSEILSLGLWLMYLTVGWHYSKQVFGCMMVYAKYDRYPLTPAQRRWIRWSLFSVAWVYGIGLAIDSSGIQLFGIGVAPFGLPPIMGRITLLVCATLVLGVLTRVVYRNWKVHRVLPSACFLVPWVAFHAWWIPIPSLTPLEFYAGAVPFFHSLQYLPFAYQREARSIPVRRYYLKATLKLALLFMVGFCAFDLVPNLLDSTLDTPGKFRAWFFLIAAAVFINVHHFFIDSVCWKLEDQGVREALF